MLIYIRKTDPVRLKTDPYLLGGAGVYFAPAFVCKKNRIIVTFGNINCSYFLLKRVKIGIKFHRLRTGTGIYKKSFYVPVGTAVLVSV